jgi:hypothetical protein
MNNKDAEDFAMGGSDFIWSSIKEMENQVISVFPNKKDAATKQLHGKLLHITLFLISQEVENKETLLDYVEEHYDFCIELLDGLNGEKSNAH